MRVMLIIIAQFANPHIERKSALQCIGIHIVSHLHLFSHRKSIVRELLDSMRWNRFANET